MEGRKYGSSSVSLCELCWTNVIEALCNLFDLVSVDNSSLS